MNSIWSCVTDCMLADFNIIIKADSLIDLIEILPLGAYHVCTCDNYNLGQYYPRKKKNS